jgi:hypothetical protein
LSSVKYDKVVCASDYYLMPNEQLFRWWEQVTFWWWCPLCTRSTHWVDFL